MPFRRYRPRRFSRRPRRTLLRRSKASKVSKKVKSYVKRAIHRNIENKEIISYTSNQTCKTWGSGINGFSLPLLQTIVQGTADQNRIGNQIRVVSGIIKGQVNLKPYDGSTNPYPMPVWVKMYIFRDLSQTQQQSTFNLGGNCFKGNGTYLPFQGNCLDLDLPVNDTQLRLLASKTFRLGSTAPSVTSPVSSGSYFDNSPMAHKFYFNWGKYVKKVLKYSDSNNNYPNNANLYLVWQPVYADGTQCANYEICETHYVNHCKFEDA